MNAPWRTEYTNLWLIIFPDDEDSYDENWGFAASDSSNTVWVIFQLHLNSTDGTTSTMAPRITYQVEGLTIWLGRVPTTSWPRVARIPSYITTQWRQFWYARDYVSVIWDMLETDGLIDNQQWVYGFQRLRQYVA